MPPFLAGGDMIEKVESMAKDTAGEIKESAKDVVEDSFEIVKESVK